MSTTSAARPYNSAENQRFLENWFVSGRRRQVNLKIGLERKGRFGSLSVWGLNLSDRDGVVVSLVV